jgi:hypothetical protein
MSSMTDPYDSLTGLQTAFKLKQIVLNNCKTTDFIKMHSDKPQGQLRFTYARMEGKKVVSIVVIIPAEPIERVPCMAIGYATHKLRRKKGLAIKTIKASLKEFEHGMNRNGVSEMMIEAIVGKENIASQKVAERVFKVEPREGTDQFSGEACLAYVGKLSEIARD